MRTRAHALALIVAMPAAVASGAPAPVPERSDLEETVEVRLVRLPVTLREQTEGACEGLAAESIEVVEDGLPVRARHLDAARMRTLHVVLMDTSRSVIDAFQDVKRAALDYIASLPADEPFALATFDDSLILHTPVSTDRSGLEEEVSLTETGWGTRLWDASAQAVRYMSTLPGRKVLVVLTNGCDSGYPGEVSPEAVAERASRVELLTVHTVGIALPASCKGQGRPGENPALALRSLARATGGALWEIASASELRDILPAIRSRLDRERYVTYEPVPFGEGPKDKPDVRDFRWRRVKIRQRERRACRVLPVGSRLRYASASGEPFRLAPPRGEESPLRPFTLDEDRSLLRGEVRDRVQDVGPRYTPTEGLTGVLHEDFLVSVEGPSSASREAWALVPPFDALVRPDARPEDAWLRLVAALGGLAGEPRPAVPAGGWRRWTDVPFVVHGRTLLGGLGSLAAALATHPDYRRWADGRIRDERLAEVEALLRESGASDVPERLALIREAFEVGSWRPHPDEYPRHLGSWLGDLHAVDLFLAAETFLARRALAATEEGGAEALERAVAEAERVWERVRISLPPPTDVRLLGLLVPGYDPSTEAIGFYRVVLPRPQPFRPLWNFSYDAPHGVRLLRWMLGRDGVARHIEGKLAVRGVRYERGNAERIGDLLRTAGLHDLGQWKGHPWARLVSIDLGSRDRPETTLRVGGYLTTDGSAAGLPAGEPVCLVLPERDDRNRDLAPLVLDLLSVKRRSAVPCVLHEVQVRSVFPGR